VPWQTTWSEAWVEAGVYYASAAGWRVRYDNLVAALP